MHSIKQRVTEINRSKTKLCQLKVSVAGVEAITEPVINTVGSEVISEDTGLWQVKELSSVNEEADHDDYLQIYSAEEVASVFCLPVPGNEGINGIPLTYPYLPPNLSSAGAVLGFRKTVRGKETIRIAESDRDKHLYLLGQTGTGKTTLLYSMAMSDIREGRGVCVIDPHDDLHERLIARIPESRLDDVILFDPTDYEYPVGLNLLEGETEKEKSFLANELIQILRKVYDPHNSGFTGPIFEQAVRNAALTAMALPDGGTVVDVPVLLTQKGFTKGILEHIEDERIKTYWKEIWFKQGMNYGELLAYITSKFDNIHTDPIMRRVMGQTKSTFNFRQVMDEGKILLVNLSKGGLGELNSYLLGSILVVKLFTAALSRYDLPAEKRKPYCLYIDEFQNFTTDTVQSMLSEARKYRLALVLAHQNLKQLSEMTRQSVLGNVGSLVFFRPGAQDAHFVQEYLKPYFFEKDLIDMPNWSAVGRLMINATPSRPFVFQVDRDRTKEDRAVVKYVRDRSRSLYARSSITVEKEIIKRHSLNNCEEDDDSSILS